MNRRKQREHTFKELFLKEFYTTEEFVDQCNLYLEEQEELIQEERELLAGQAKFLQEKMEILDARINHIAEGWQTDRMSKVDVTILRLATYEIFFDEEIPVRVAINEAVELAKRYGGEDSASFVNGILGRMVREEGMVMHDDVCDDTGEEAI